MLCTTSPISSILHKMEEDEIVCKEVRIALGVAAPTPMRAVKAESLLRGKKLSDELLEEVAQHRRQRSSAQGQHPRRGLVPERHDQGFGEADGDEID